MSEGLENLRGRVAVVTGAANGIGRAIAQRLANQGAHLVLADIDTQGMGEVADELRSAGAEVVTVETDVTSFAQVQALADKTLDRFGAVNVLCNNAGILVYGSHTELNVDEWRRAMEVDFFSVVNGHTVFLPIMLAQDQPCHIVNTASIAGLMSTGLLGPYHAAKYAVVALSESLQIELAAREGCNVNVSVLCPEFVKTRIADTRRYRPTREPGPTEAAAEESVFAAAAGGIDPLVLGDRVVDAIRYGEFWVLTHPSSRATLEERFEGILNAIPGEGA
jgi:NAD(P)-dependent dehydrogenase (short-subunit alcohol dehydrogenase family)